jgi:hypothetical protein
VHADAAPRRARVTVVRRHPVSGGSYLRSSSRTSRRPLG